MDDRDAERESQPPDGEPGLGPAGARQTREEDAEGAEALITGPALGPQVLEGEDDLPRQPTPGATRTSRSRELGPASGARSG